MVDIYSDSYWQSKFTITEADLNRLENYIRETGKAYDLTALARRIIRGRLRYGREISPAALGVQTALTDHSVRLWDPAGEWQIGNHVVIWTWSFARRVEEVKIGEIVEQNPQYVFIQVDDIKNQKRQFERAAPGSQEAIKWRQKVENVVARLREARDIEEWIELISLKHGNQVASQLLNALQSNKRFVRLSGRWFLRSLAEMPTEIQLSKLAWLMLELEEPQPTEALLPKTLLPMAPGDPGLFGLYLALQSHPQLFANADPDQRPRWKLVGPPPGPIAAKYAAYDPADYHVLCEPGETVSERTAQRLWDLNLFSTICHQQVSS